MSNKIIFLVLFFIISIHANTSQNGAISGKVLDNSNQLILIGVNIFNQNTQNGTTTDNKGNFTINNLTAGSYTIKFSYIGYHSVTKTDIIVRPGKTTFVNIGMSEEIIKLNNITVTSGYFTNVEKKGMSAINFSSEEVRRAPGAAGDISRILFSMPSVAKVNDNSNSLIVRGGTPIENSFYVDNIEIPNINHFPTQGSSDGPIGILNVDFIDDVTFYSGGFSTAYGDKMSSVMDIKFRDGNRNNFNSKLNLSFAGINAIAEGPLGNSGSYMVAGNKSYLDLIFKAIDETGTVPEYGDFQTKLSFDVDENNKLSFLDVLAIDYINNKYKSSFEKGFYVYGPAQMITNTAGLNWRYIWGKSGYSNTSITFTYNDNDYEFFRTKTQMSLLTTYQHNHILIFYPSSLYEQPKAVVNRLDYLLGVFINDFNFDFKYDNTKPANNIYKDDKIKSWNWPIKLYVVPVVNSSVKRIVVNPIQKKQLHFIFHELSFYSDYDKMYFDFTYKLIDLLNYSFNVNQSKSHSILI